MLEKVVRKLSMGQMPPEGARRPDQATLDAFVTAMTEILNEARENPELVKKAPHTTPVRRLDDVRAARELGLVWRPS